MMSTTTALVPRALRTGLACIACAAALMLTACTTSHYTVQASNVSSENVALEIVDARAEEGARPIAGCVMGPGGSFRWSSESEARPSLRMSRWDNGEKSGTLRVDVPRGGTVKMDIDTDEGALTLKNFQLRQ